MLVKTTQYKSSGTSSANLLRALEIFDLPPAISPELNKYPGSNPARKQFANVSYFIYLAEAVRLAKRKLLNVDL